MMKSTKCGVWVIALGCALSAAGQKRPAQAALEGLDPVLLVEGKETPGNEALSAQQGRFVYYFASVETRDKFRASPERYSIQLDGACARMGPPVDGSPDAYFVYKGRIYIFGSAECYKRFTAAPAKYLESEQPKDEWKPSPSSMARGEALRKKIIGAMGGDALLQVHSYVEVRKITQGGRDMARTRTVRLPDTFRVETRRDDMTFGNMAGPFGVINFFRDEGIRLPEAYGKAILAEAEREPLPLLLAKGEYFAYSTEELIVSQDGRLTRVVVDPATSRISSIIYRGRGPTGEFGIVRMAYSDYRSVGGVQLPFRTQGEFNGQPDPTHEWTVTTYQLNPSDIAARFPLPAKLRE